MDGPTTGGWYNGRRHGYRSVAFGTWKVGGARILTAKSQATNDETISSSASSSSSSSSSSSYPNQSLDVARRMGESSPNLCRLHPTDTQRSLGALPSYSVDHRLCLASAQDCYSSSEYVAYTERRVDTGNAASEPVQAAFRGDLSSQRRCRLENSLQRVHYRSASAGADASYSVRASTSEMKSPLALNRENTRFLRATKKFFKKIYNSATLPSNRKQEQKAMSVEPRRFDRVEYPDPIWVPPPSIRMMDDDLEDDHTSRVESMCGSSPLDATDSGVDVDRASTPDHSVESITMTSKSDDDCQDLSYTEIFENLRREMHLLRQRDHKILAELHRAEETLRTARRTRDDRYGLRGFPV